MVSTFDCRKVDPGFDSRPSNLDGFYSRSNSDEELRGPPHNSALPVRSHTIKP